MKTKALVACVVALSNLFAPLVGAQEEKPKEDLTQVLFTSVRIFMLSAKPSAKGWRFMKGNPGDRKAAMEEIEGADDTLK